MMFVIITYSRSVMPVTVATADSLDELSLKLLRSGKTQMAEATCSLKGLTDWKFIGMFQTLDGEECRHYITRFPTDAL